MRRFFKNELSHCISEDINIIVSDNRAMLDSQIVQLIEDVEAKTSEYSNVFLNIGISYGGRNEIIRAMLSCINEIASGIITMEDISEAVFSKYLDTKGHPDID